MIYLVFSILSSTLIFIVFKFFRRFNINTLQAIVVNYIVACSCGLISYNEAIDVVLLPTYKWFYFTSMRFIK